MLTKRGGFVSKLSACIRLECVASELRRKRYRTVQDCRFMVSGSKGRFLDVGTELVDGGVSTKSSANASDG
ncbi:hypothetical protein LZC95_35045 [Pendulispora brunnea]|uniref:Uncharacterized protein n=1 Tax=Pendulispora brunnea TaxID=2905690 RepID=A0ABZ2K2R7_9BACT